MSAVTIRTTERERRLLDELPEKLSFETARDAQAFAVDLERFAERFRNDRNFGSPEVLDAVAKRLEKAALRYADRAVGGNGPAGLKAFFS